MLDPRTLGAAERRASASDFSRFKVAAAIYGTNEDGLDALEKRFDAEDRARLLNTVREVRAAVAAGVIGDVGAVGQMASAWTTELAAVGLFDAVKAAGAIELAMLQWHGEIGTIVAGEVSELAKKPVKRIALALGALPELRKVAAIVYMSNASGADHRYRSCVAQLRGEGSDVIFLDEA